MNFKINPKRCIFWDLFHMMCLLVNKQYTIKNSKIQKRNPNLPPSILLLGANGVKYWNVIFHISNLLQLLDGVIWGCFYTFLCILQYNCSFFVSSIAVTGKTLYIIGYQNSCLGSWLILTYIDPLKNCDVAMSHVVLPPYSQNWFENYLYKLQNTWYLCMESTEIILETTHQNTCKEQIT